MSKSRFVSLQDYINNLTYFFAVLIEAMRKILMLAQAESSWLYKETQANILLHSLLWVRFAVKKKPFFRERSLWVKLSAAPTVKDLTSFDVKDCGVAAKWSKVCHHARGHFTCLRQTSRAKHASRADRHTSLQKVLAFASAFCWCRWSGSNRHDVATEGF